ncbi:MAG: preprotein translocase subunit YajC [Candidatus Omnitrophica bacterium]|nr:preprotein translocase subunit YajC [Candidatus Omnitrophota bacterium]
MFEKIAYAATPAGQPEMNPLASFFPFILIIIIFYIFLIRPQQKRQKDVQTMVDNLKKGDRVITAGGIIGTVTSIQKDYVVIKTSDHEGSKMEVLKSAISGLRQQGE